MKFYSFIVPILCVAQVYSEENLPEICKNPPNTEDSQKCCTTPDMFTESELKACNEQRRMEDIPTRKMNKEQMDAFHKASCKKNECILKTRGLLNATGGVDRAKARVLLTEHGEKHPEFKSVLARARDFCLPTAGSIPGHEDFCEPIKFFVCIATMVFSDCPAQFWIKSEKCDQVQTYLKTCKHHLLH